MPRASGHAKMVPAVAKAARMSIEVALIRGLPRKAAHIKRSTARITRGAALGKSRGSTIATTAPNALTLAKIAIDSIKRRKYKIGGGQSFSHRTKAGVITTAAAASANHQATQVEARFLCQSISVKVAATYEPTLALTAATNIAIKINLAVVAGLAKALRPAAHQSTR